MATAIIINMAKTGEIALKSLLRCFIYLPPQTIQPIIYIKLKGFRNDSLMQKQFKPNNA
jgi:hypothetical protein